MFSSQSIWRVFLITHSLLAFLGSRRTTFTTALIVCPSITTRALVSVRSSSPSSSSSYNKNSPRSPFPTKIVKTSSMPVTRRKVGSTGQTEALLQDDEVLDNGDGSPATTDTDSFLQDGELRVPEDRRIKKTTGSVLKEDDVIDKTADVHVDEPEEGEEPLDNQDIRRIESFRGTLYMFDGEDKPSVVPFGISKECKEETVQIPLHFTVNKAVEFMRDVASEDDRILCSHDRVYVTERGVLKGYVTMASLLTSNPKQKIANILKKPEAVLNEGDRWEEAAQRLRSSSIYAAPVVDSSYNLVAILNPEDLLKEMEKETTDDIMRFSGSGGGESYFGTPLSRLVASRVGWLVSLLFLQSLSSVILTAFQKVLERNIVIALFLTMLTGTAGNAGNQSSAMIIRGIATGEINRGNTWKAIRREGKAAFAASVILSVASFVRVWFTPGSTFMSSIAVSVSLGLTVIGAVLFGTICPIVLDRWGMDPVNFASPALATLTDVSGVLVLCTLSSAILP